MYPRRLLAVLGLAAFIGSLVVFAPLKSLVRLAPETSALRSLDVEGTLLDARVSSPTGEVVGYFQLQPLYLLTLGLGGAWQAEGGDMKGRGDVVLRPWGYSIVVEAGEVSAGRLGVLLGADGFETVQPLYLRGVSVSGAPGAGLRAAKGRLSWGPGEVRLRNRAQAVAVPALVGQLQTTEGNVELLVGTDAAPDAPLLTASLALPTRELHLVVLGRAVKLLGLGGKHADDAAAFELRQTLGRAPPEG